LLAVLSGSQQFFRLARAPHSRSRISVGDRRIDSQPLSEFRSRNRPRGPLLEQKKLLRTKSQGYRGTRSSPRDRLPTLPGPFALDRMGIWMVGKRPVSATPGKKGAGSTGRGFAGIRRRPSPPTSSIPLDFVPCALLLPPAARSPPFSTRPARLPLGQPSRRCRRVASRRVVSVPPSASSLSVALAYPLLAVPPSLHPRVARYNSAVECARSSPSLEGGTRADFGAALSAYRSRERGSPRSFSFSSSLSLSSSLAPLPLSTFYVTRSRIGPPQLSRLASLT